MSTFSPFENIFVVDKKIFIAKDNTYCSCSRCHNHYMKDEMIMIDSYLDFICLNCLKKEYGIVISNCKHCGKKIVDGCSYLIGLICNKYSYTLGQYGFCLDCYRNHKCNHPNCNCEVVEGHKYCQNHIGYERFYQYDFKPEPIFKGDLFNEKDFYIGVELELNFKNEIDQFDFLKLYDTDFFYCKKDGSLSKFGVEIVSHPATLKYHVNSNCWTKLFNLLDKYNLDTKNCGLHFHISRKNLSKESIYNIDYFVNNYDKIINEIGSRGYTNFANKTKENCFCIYGDDRPSTHYDACNLSNRNTIELRFCKSTYNFKTFMKKIKMIFTLVYLCEQVDNKQIHNKGFIKKSFDSIKNEIMSRI